MKQALITLMFMLGLGLLSGQTISNLRVDQHPELRYYRITFDLTGKAGEFYLIKAVPYKGNRELSNLQYLSGQGVVQPCNPGNDLQIFWAADLEGFETEGWKFRLTPTYGMISMVLIEGGSYQMGSDDGARDEKPVHQVTVSSFWIGKYEVTQAEWKEVMDTNPSNWNGNDLPVENVTWYDSIEYCNKLSQKEGLEKCYSGSGTNIICDWSANGYRLPTEAEWEYAARGGNLGKGYKYSGYNDIGSVAWYNDNSYDKTHGVGKKKANEQGLYDLSGNVWEWCWDCYDSGYYAKSIDNNPRGRQLSPHRLLRGGAWNEDYNSCRVANRNASFPDQGSSNIGFRIVRTTL